VVVIVSVKAKSPFLNLKKSKMKNRDNVIKVRLMVFSGRPDPEWEADDALLNEITTKYRESRDRKESAEAPRPVLGYRGFLIENGAKLESLPENLIVSKGTITERANGRDVSWKDTAGLEQTLLSFAKERDFAEILEQLGY
jgi:hypothetical protein